MTLFFTADEHYGSKGIIHFCNRGYSDPTIMNQDIIYKHNSVVGLNDTVYHIGDITFDSDEKLIKSILKQLNGTHILILGNHDKSNPFDLIEAGFRSVHTSLELIIDVYNVVLAHDPSIWTVVPPDTIFICGHIHKLFRSFPDKLVVNAGVDVHNFYPISFKQILEELKLI